MRSGDGFVVAGGRLPKGEFVFETGRFSVDGVVPEVDLKPIHDEVVEKVFRCLAERMEPWSVECQVEDGADERALRRVNGIARQLQRALKRWNRELFDLFRRKSRADRCCLVLYLTGEGLWFGVRATGGMESFRMRMDEEAPSRSYLKLEEAFFRMGCCPVAGERVIDLGAAPGGWTYACLKRGAEVLAVDHGPLKLKNTGCGRVQHIKANGLTFGIPENWEQVDWLVGDMLVDPGAATGLLRRWMQQRSVRHVVCNVKIPQREPYEAIRSLLRELAANHAWDSAVKQLYHNRREVTVMAINRLASARV